MGLANKARRQARNLRSEVRFSPAARGLGAGVAAAAAAAASGVPRRRLLLVGAAVAVAHRHQSISTLRLEREIRSARDATHLAGGSPVPGAFFGDFSIDGDAGRVISRELEQQPKTVVECGCGTSTLLVASALERNGEGRLYSIEHDPAYAQRVAAHLADAGLSERVELIVAPLQSQRFGSVEVEWYDRREVDGRLTEPIDLLLVDGPRSLGTWSRWPAVEVFHGRLAQGATVLLDDGRRRAERRTAVRWASEFRDLELYWIDTAKGTWRLVKRHDPVRRSSELLGRLARALNPCPPGRGLVPVRR